MNLDDTTAQLVNGNINYAKGLARQFYANRTYCGLDLDDFISAGFVGLCDAARRFAPERSTNFRSYAYLRITGAMRDLLRDGGYTTRKQLRALTGFGETEVEGRNRVASTNGALCTPSEIVFEAGIRLHINQYRQVQDLSYVQQNDPEFLSGQRAQYAFLQKVLAELPKREQRVLWLRYFEEQSFEQMRKEFNGATRSWLCRIHSRALKRLRKKLDNYEAGCQTKIIANA